MATELQAIIQRMRAEGRSEEDIAKVVAEHKARNETPDNSEAKNIIARAIQKNTGKTPGQQEEESIEKAKANQTTISAYGTDVSIAPEIEYKRTQTWKHQQDNYNNGLQELLSNPNVTQEEINNYNLNKPRDFEINNNEVTSDADPNPLLSTQLILFPKTNDEKLVWIKESAKELGIKEADLQASIDGKGIDKVIEEMRVSLEPPNMFDEIEATKAKLKAFQNGEIQISTEELSKYKQQGFITVNPDLVASINVPDTDEVRASYMEKNSKADWIKRQKEISKNLGIPQPEDDEAYNEYIVQKMDEDQDEIIQGFQVDAVNKYILDQEEVKTAMQLETDNLTTNFKTTTIPEIMENTFSTSEDAIAIDKKRKGAITAIDAMKLDIEGWGDSVEAEEWASTVEEREERCRKWGIQCEAMWYNSPKNVKIDDFNRAIKNYNLMLEDEEDKATYNGLLEKAQEEITRRFNAKINEAYSGNNVITRAYQMAGLGANEAYAQKNIGLDLTRQASDLSVWIDEQIEEGKFAAENPDHAKYLFGGNWLSRAKWGAANMAEGWRKSVYDSETGRLGSKTGVTLNQIQMTLRQPQFESRGKIVEELGNSFESGKINKDMSISEAIDILGKDSALAKRLENKFLSNFDRVNWSLDDNIGDYYDKKVKRLANTTEEMEEDAEDLWGSKDGTWQGHEDRVMDFLEVDFDDAPITTIQGLMGRAAHGIEQFQTMALPGLGKLSFLGSFIAAAASGPTGGVTAPLAAVLFKAGIVLETVGGMAEGAQIYASSFMGNLKTQMDKDLGAGKYTTEQYLDALKSGKYSQHLIPLATGSAAAGVSIGSGILQGYVGKGVLGNLMKRKGVQKIMENTFGNFIARKIVLPGASYAITPFMEGLEEEYQSIIEQSGEILMNLGPNEKFKSAFTEKMDWEQVAMEKKMGYQTAQFFGAAGGISSTFMGGKANYGQEALNIASTINLAKDSKTFTTANKTFENLIEKINKDNLLTPDQKRTEIQKVSSIRNAGILASNTEGISSINKNKLVNLFVEQNELENKIKQNNNKQASVLDIERKNEIDAEIESIIREGAVQEESLKGPTSAMGIIPTGTATDTDQVNDKQSRDVDKARAGDVATQQEFEKYGIDWEYKPIYRFVGKSEVDALNNDETIEGKNKEVGVDITISEDPTSGTDAGYRITFKEEGFDQAKPNSRARMKNEEDGWVRGGYKKDDVLTIEKRNADGTYEIVYDANSEQNELNKISIDLYKDPNTSETDKNRETKNLINDNAGFFLGPKDKGGIDFVTNFEGYRNKDTGKFITRQEVLNEVSALLPGIIGAFNTKGKANFTTYAGVSLNAKLPAIKESLIGAKEASKTKETTTQELENIVAEETEETKGKEFEKRKYPTDIATVEKQTAGVRPKILNNIKESVKSFMASAVGKTKEIGGKGKTVITKLDPASVEKDLKAKNKATEAAVAAAIGKQNSKQYKDFVTNIINEGYIETIPIAAMKKRFQNVKGFKIEKTGRETLGAGTGIYKLSDLNKQALIDFYTKDQSGRRSFIGLLAKGLTIEQFQEVKTDKAFMNDLAFKLKEDGSKLTAEEFMNEVERIYDKRTIEKRSLDDTSNIDRFIDNVLEPRIKESGGAAGSSPTPGAIAQAMKTALKGYQSLIKAGKTFKEALSRFIKDFIEALQTQYSLTRNQIKGVTDLIKQKLQKAFDFNQKNLRELIKDFDLKLKGKSKVDSLLTKAGLNKTLDLSTLILTRKGRKKIVDTFRDEVFILLPRAAWQQKDAFTNSARMYGINRSSATKAENAAFDQLKQDIKDEIENATDSAFGDDIYDADGNIVDFKISSYGTVFKGTEIEIKDKAQKFNTQVAAIHKAMWERINKRINRVNPETGKKDKNRASGIATYLKFTAEDRDSWHKRGAQIFGYSLNPKGIGSTLFEYEHAMPATAAYLYLLDASLEGKRFDSIYDLVIDDYKVIALDSVENAKLGKAHLGRSMPEGWNVFDNSWWERYFNPQVAKINGGINPSNIVDLNGKPLSEVFNINNKGEAAKSAELIKSEKKAKNKIDKLAHTITNKNQTTAETKETLENSLDTQVNAQKVNKKKKGISVFDFDDTLAKTKEKVIVTMRDGTIKTLSPAEFAQQALDLESEGASFDFSQFEDVKGAKKGPLADLALKRQGKFGSGDIFILTARPQTSAQGIKTFLDGIGLNIPIENITGLEDGTPQAKADWVLSKTKEGYNDFYFADDSKMNVNAVKQILSQVDVKSVVQQAITDKAVILDKEFNTQIEETTGLKADAKYSPVRAQLEGRKKDKGFFKWFGRQLTITPSAEDFMGLMYDLMGSGKQGNRHAKWVRDNLIDPYNKAEQSILSAKVAVANDFAALKKAFPSLRSSIKGNPLMDQIGVGPYTKSQAMRVYIWNKQGMEIPGLSKRDQNALVRAVEADSELNVFADNVILIQKDKQYPSPTNNWAGGTIDSDIMSSIDKTFRRKVMTEFDENTKIIFSDKNMNKLEALYGQKWVDGLRDSLRRMKSGSNRPVYQGGGARIVNEMLDWLNGSVGAVMFLNVKSGLLQLISNVNFINWGDNNIYAAAKAFASKEYWPTVMKLMNSDYLVNRRDGLKINVNEAELANAAKDGGMKGAIAYLLDKGFIITRIMDSLAIATGGATFYINRRNALLERQNPETGKKYTKAEAEAKAFDDFYAISEESQQSSNPSKISQQQASLAGRVLLAFQNVTMQYNRMTKKSIRDLYNRRKNPGQTQRESDLGNLSKIIYYTTIQNLIFNALQQALFAMVFDDEPEDKEKNRAANIANGMSDSLLFGLGFGGAAISTVKNVLLKVMEESDKKSPDYEEAVWEIFNVSPVLDSKVRKLRTTAKTFSWNREEIAKRGWSLDNPSYLAISQLISAATNIPIDRVLRKMMNMRMAMDEETRTWQRVALMLGWSSWSLGLPYWGLQSTIEKEAEEKEKIKASYKSDIRKMKASGYKKVMARVLKDYDPKDIIELRSPAGTVVYYAKANAAKQAKN